MGDDSLPFERVSVDDAKKVMETTALPPKVEEKDWRWARKWTPPEPLKPATVAWLLALPSESRPIDLPQAYPRIINRLCEIWPQPELCDKYFEELLNDLRGRRKGFPDAVLAEIKMLQKHYAGGSAKGTWELEATRRR